jgi:carotenoid cleavage dioxygenase
MAEPLSRREFLDRVAAAGLAAGAAALDRSEAAAPGDPHLSGNFAPVAEERDAADLPVEGRLPDGLEGAYMRNGPNPAFPPLSYTYPLDGDGMIHAVHFEGGRARYRNRWVATRGLRAERRVGRALYGGVQQPVRVDRALVGPDGDPGPFKNVANTNVVRHAGRILALYEAGLPYALTDDLETIGEWTFHGRLDAAMTAHPRVDPVSGELHFFRYGSRRPYLVYFVADRGGRIVRRVPITLPEPVMLHDFVVTPRHVVFFDCPAVLTERGFVWKGERETRVGVLSRAAAGRAPRWFPMPPFFVFHFVNAFDGGRRITVDYVRHATFGGAPPPPGTARRPPALHRLTVHLAGGGATDTPLDDHPVEFPRFDERRTGRAHRFAYVPTRGDASGPPGLFDGLLRYDAERGTTSIHRYGAGRFTGEAVFVPRPGATGEQDGWVLSFVYDAGRDASDCVVLDAGDFTGPPAAVVRLPARVPEGLHGNWFPGPLGATRPR